MQFRLFLALVPATIVVAVVACDRANDLSATADVASVKQVPQLLSTDTLAKYKAALPKVAYAKLQTILQDPDTFWYDHEVMPPSYQDTVAPDVTVGCRQNNAGADLIDVIPGGRQIFSTDAQTFNFPFGHTAGTDSSKNTHIVDFMWLPSAGGKRLPVVYQVKDGTRSSFDTRQWRWMFPKGTVFGELIFVKDSSGALYPSELRTRERFGAAWATNAYRPFTSAAALANAVKAERPSWESVASLKAMITSLGDLSTLTTKRLSSKVFPGVFDQEGAIDVLPELEPDLVKGLLSKTTFVSSYGTTWKDNGSKKAFAPSASGFSIVPDAYDAGILEVRDASCQRCHKDAQRAINDFNEEAVLYGDIWGSDQIFSFHPFDPRLCHGAAEDNRALRPVFEESGLVQRYDPTKHTATYYQELKK